MAGSESRVELPEQELLLALMLLLHTNCEYYIRVVYQHVNISWVYILKIMNFFMNRIHNLKNYYYD